MRHETYPQVLNHCSTGEISLEGTPAGVHVGSAL